MRKRTGWIVVFFVLFSIALGSCDNTDDTAQQESQVYQDTNPVTVTVDEGGNVSESE